MPASNTALVGLILAAASWGLGTVISKHAVEEIPPLVLLTVQLAASVLALTVLLRVRRIPLVDRSMPSALARLGVLNPGIAYTLSLLGLTQITASLSVLLWTAEPILVVLLAGVVLHERVGPRFLGLSALAALGLALVIGAPGDTSSILGIGLTLAAIACCAVYTVLARGQLSDPEATPAVVLAQQAHGLAFVTPLLLLAIAAGVVSLPPSVSPAAWASAVGSGVLYYAAAYWFYVSALARLPASTAAASFYLIPVFGVGGGILLLGESLTPLQWVGAVLVLASVVRLLAPVRQHAGAAGFDPGERRSARSTGGGGAGS